MKKYILVAGVNGAGKSTLYHLNPNLECKNRVNADDILKEFKGNWKNTSDRFMAGRKAISLIHSYIDEGVSFNQETTLCGATIIKNIQKAKEYGFAIEMHYIGLESSLIAKERVAKRVAMGGHGVSEDDIERRYINSFNAFNKVLPLCDLVAVYDNTTELRRFAIFKNGKLVRLSHRVPQWFTSIYDEDR